MAFFGGAVAAGVGGAWWLFWLVAVGFSVHEVPSEKSARVVSVAWSVIIGAVAGKSCGAP